MSSCASDLQSSLAKLLGGEAVITDESTLELLSSDIYSRGITAAFAVKPSRREGLPEAIRQITEAGYAIFPRGGGMSYTSGYIPTREKSVIIDTSGLNSIVDINEEDMTITVETGVTWQQIYKALESTKFRLPFFGTFSGIKATVGGGMSNGALFMGTARYGTGAEIVIGMDVITASGRLIKTGQAGFRNGKPFFRNYGPDLTGLFVHDAGALGVKTLVSLRLMRKPEHEGYASFVFSKTEEAVACLSEIARSGRVEEVYIFDPVATRLGLNTSDIKKDLTRLVNVVRSQGSLIRGLKEGAALVGAGRSFVAEDVFTLHVVCSANTRAQVDDDLAVCRETVENNNGGEIANSMPKAARANPFEPLNPVLGSRGDRWAALNSKVSHSDALALVEATDKILEKHKEAMEEHGVLCSRLFIAISNHVFSFEPVFRWCDEWLPLHHDTPEKSYLANLQEPEANIAGRELVATMRQEIVDLFASFGVGSNQIGKTYPYFSSLQPETASFVADLKEAIDPKGLMNPGALGFPENA